MASGTVRRISRSAAGRMRTALRGRRSRALQPDTEERALARLLSPLDPDAEEVHDDPEGADEEDASPDEPWSTPAALIGRPRRVLAVAGPRVRARLVNRPDLPMLRELVPGYPLVTDPAPGPRDLVVLDRAALNEGPWAGVESATGTRLAMSLLSVLDELRGKGCQVVLVDDVGPPNVNTNLLVERADIILPEARTADAVLGDPPRTPLMALLQEVALEQTGVAAVGEDSP